MNYNRNYDIVTLRDCIGCDDQPAPHLSGVFDDVWSFGKGLFGDDRRELTISDWNQLFPGNGYWSNRLKQYLAGKIKYDTDMKFVYDHGKGTGDFDNFASENKCQLFSNYPSCIPPEGIRAGLQRVLQQELIAPGQVAPTPLPISPNLIPGQTGFTAPTTLTGALPLIAGVVVVGMLLSKQKPQRRRR